MSPRDSVKEKRSRPQLLIGAMLELVAVHDEHDGWDGEEEVREYKGNCVDS